MPVFHTRTIESILEPVAQQVSRLVIIHEEGEAGHEMPDLERPVLAVSKAVTNLVKVGRDMSSSTDDLILQQDMPQALNKVEGAARMLVEASQLSKIDPLSKPARMKLIEGSRWILQGTSNVLLVFDESEVRKIVQECKKVLDYLSVAEVIETVEDLVQFVRDLSPILSRVTSEVSKRTEDLTHQIHREVLSRCVEQVKTLAPILICSMKIFIQILVQDGKGVDEAAENRNYLSGRMSEELNEIIRVLQLTTYDEDEWDSDNLTVMKKIQNAIESSMQNAHDWLKDPRALQGGVGEKSVRRILEQALMAAERSLPLDAEHMRKLAGDIQCMTDSLCELRTKGEGTSPQAETLADNIEARLRELSGIQQPAPTVSGRLEQARRWLEQPNIDDRGLGQQAIALVVEEGMKIADVLPEGHKDEVTALCRRIQADAYSLTMLCQAEQGDSPRAVELSRNIAGNLNRLKDVIRSALIDRVVEDFLDAVTPLKQFTQCIISPNPNEVTRDIIFEDKATKLSIFSGKAVRTAKMVAVGTNSGNKKVAEALLAYSVQVESLTPQLVNAGRIRMVYPDNKAADEHFENLRHQYAEAVQRVRGLCDEATDSLSFIEQSLAAMEDRTDNCEDAIRAGQALKLVENTSALARMTNRIIQVAKQEAENSEDPRYISQLHISAEQLQSRIAPMVQSAKSLALNMDDEALINEWRANNRKNFSRSAGSRTVHTGSSGAKATRPPKPARTSVEAQIDDLNQLLDSVQGVQSAVGQYPAETLPPPLPPYPKIGDLSLSDSKTSGSATMPVATSRGHQTQEMKSASKSASSSNIMSHYNQQNSSAQQGGRGKQPKVFSDSELSEIFQIDFGEIFGSPDAGLTNFNDYKGINLPSKNSRDSPGSAPPRPPPPSGGFHHGHSNSSPFLPNTPVYPETTDDESEDLFLHAPSPSQGPIMMAAHDLHQEVKQWSSKDNDIIAAAKKMALLMAKLSHLVNEDTGSKRELIACAKAIADSSEDVTRIAKELAKECTDKRMRTGLLQVCERIPTIATQLKILSTVKATMLGVQGTEEDEEATEMLVGNAQNLMQSVKQTVTAAEAASIKIRTDAGIKLRWVRKQPWYQY
eukprot:maker-scaffold1333_size47127-snap-gene-0.11 protein:Tk10849 transcript:maker-scaffold1333_size47127-snap-gene-0.11-mRNA-1 annotation:"vinculin-like isoform 1"